jgi:hypothetical protein
LEKNETLPTDPNSKESSEIVVPPDILAQAQLGDHFETVNPDKEDMHSAFGNPESKMFHSIQGDASPAGGGGNGGVGLDELIGVGGATSVGSGGGWGGGTGTGVGVGSGAGHGSFGNRNGGGRQAMVKRHGGSQQTEDAVNKALEWLAYHQEPDGHWNSQKFGAHYCVDVGISGLALLAFLGAGHSEKVGKYKSNVQNAVAWLIKQQKDNGSFPGPGRGYEIAIATMALSEATGMANIKTTRDAAQKAVNYCTEIHQQGDGSEKGGWRYDPKTEPDMSVMGWFVMAMKSAKVAGLSVNPASIEGAMKKLEKLQSSVEAFVNGGGVPAWTNDPPGGEEFKIGSTDLYYWYYGTLCVFQMGGDVWKKWNVGLKKALVENQCRGGGDDDGSWNPVGAYSHQWGRVGQTALGALCLEVYYRYARLNQEAK